MVSNRAVERYLWKTDQHYEMAGLARMDGDQVDAERHLKLAKKYDQLAKEAYEGE